MVVCECGEAFWIDAEDGIHRCSNCGKGYRETLILYQYSADERMSYED
jgi:hypothetical protein